MVDDNDTHAVRDQLLRALSPTKFPHLWEDNPVLEPDEKCRASAENCVALTCIAVLGGRYEALEELAEVQETLPIAADVGLYTASIEQGVDFDWLDKRSMDSVGDSINKKTGREIDKDGIVKGFEYEDGKYVVISPDEIEAVYSPHHPDYRDPALHRRQAWKQQSQVSWKRPVIGFLSKYIPSTPNSRARV